MTMAGIHEVLPLEIFHLIMQFLEIDQILQLQTLNEWFFNSLDSDMFWDKLIHLYFPTITIKSGVITNTSPCSLTPNTPSTVTTTSSSSSSSSEQTGMNIKHVGKKHKFLKMISTQLPSEILLVAKNESLKNPLEPEDLSHKYRTTLLSNLRRRCQYLAENKTFLGTLLYSHKEKVYCLDYRKSLLASVAQDGCVSCYDVEDKKCSGEMIKLDTNWMLAVSIHPDMKLVAVGGLDSKVTIYDIKSCKKVTDCGLANGYISSISFVDSNHILISSGDNNAYHIDIEKKKSLFAMKHVADVMGAKLNPSNPNLIVTCSCDSHCYLWDLRTTSMVRKYESLKSDVNSVDFLPNGDAFISGDDNGNMALWDLSMDCPVKKHTTGSGDIPVVASVYYGRYALASNNSALHLIDLLDVNSPPVTVFSRERKISCIGSGNGKILCGSWEGNVYSLDLDSTKHLLK